MSLFCNIQNYIFAHFVHCYIVFAVFNMKQHNAHLLLRNKMKNLFNYAFSLLTKTGLSNEPHRCQNIYLYILYLDAELWPECEGKSWELPTESTTAPLKILEAKQHTQLWNQWWLIWCWSFMSSLHCTQLSFKKLVLWRMLILLQNTVREIVQRRYINTAVGTTFKG